MVLGKKIYVLDGGALLHRVKWQKKVTYKEIVVQYVKYVRTKYGDCCIVFDGYEQGPSTKDHACAYIKLTESTKAYGDQQTFLTNEKNKNQFVNLLSQSLEEDGRIVYNSTGDADTMIAECALNFAKEGKEVIVVADDTDVLVLLMYHWNKDLMADIYFKSETKSSNKGLTKLWNIRVLADNADPVVLSHLLFIHAWSGCDTTSATYGHGKTSLLKKLPESEEIQELSLMMSSQDSTVEDIGMAGNRLFVILYAGKKNDTLNNLRYSKYMQMLSQNKPTTVEPQKLPPTERAAFFHSLRVHLQVVRWRKLSNNCLDETQWGWKVVNDVLEPVYTDKEAAPENLLKVVRCKCKLSSKNPCGSNICSCRKHGLKCVTACGDCRGKAA